MIVIADATPLNYLVLLGRIEVLQRLYRQVIVPEAVANELLSKMAPPEVRNWINNPPNWLEIKKSQTLVDSLSEKLDPGEREALSLALEVRADLVIVDDREARKEALRRNLLVIGTLGVIKHAAEAGLLDLSDTIKKLQETTFYVSPVLLQSLLESAQGKSTEG